MSFLPIGGTAFAMGSAGGDELLTGVVVLGGVHCREIPIGVPNPKLAKIGTLVVAKNIRELNATENIKAGSIAGNNISYLLWSEVSRHNSAKIELLSRIYMTCRYE